MAHYTAALLAALRAQFPEDEYRAFDPAGHVLPSRAIFGSAAVLGRPRIDRLAGGADVVWIPAPAPVAVSQDVPYVLSVHDLSWIERPQDFTPYERVWHRVGRLERLARDAAAVLCLSEATKATIQRHWALDEDRLHVLYPGVSTPATAAEGARSGGGPAPPPPGGPAGGRPYFLAVGALEPRKDPELLRRAHERSGIDAELVFAGAGRLAPNLRGPRSHVFERFTSEQLGGLYANARTLVLPSHLEGFGFPPLEAALHGTPSIVTDLPIFRETLGDAATRIPPGDEDALVQALRHRPATGEAAGARAALFTWDAAAAKLRAVFTEVAR